VFLSSDQASSNLTANERYLLLIDSAPTMEHTFSGGHDIISLPSHKPPASTIWILTLLQKNGLSFARLMISSASRCSLSLIFAGLSIFGLLYNLHPYDPVFSADRPAERKYLYGYGYGDPVAVS